METHQLNSLPIFIRASLVLRIFLLIYCILRSTKRRFYVGIVLYYIVLCIFDKTDDNVTFINTILVETWRQKHCAPIVRFHEKQWIFPFNLVFSYRDFTIVSIIVILLFLLLFMTLRHCCYYKVLSYFHDLCSLRTDASFDAPNSRSFP